MAHLNNSNNYQLCSSDSLTTSRLLQSLTSAFWSFKNDAIWYDHERPLINHQFSFTFPKFHILPKLHKPGVVKGRPISGQVNWITTPVSTILDHRLQEHAHLFPDILTNSQQLVKDLELLNDSSFINNSNLWMITADIESLYPNIKIDRLLSIIGTIDYCCVPLTEFVCNHSYVKYNNKIYKQVDGIPMGTNAAVTLANFYVGSLIDQFICSRPEVLYYRRYIDDLFIIWKDDLTRWPSAATAITRLLGITINFDPPSKDHAIFLDLQITRCSYDNLFKTCVYQKPLNKYNYITPTSTHAPHMFSGFIKGELTRYARLSTDAFAYYHTKHLFFERLLQRGYTRRYLRPLFKRHRWTIRLNEDTSTSHKILPFVIPYTLRANASSIPKIVKTKATDIESYFNHSKVIIAYQRRRNLLDLLCPSSITRDHSRLLQSRKFLFDSIRHGPFNV
jgi:hypothetical protein